MLVKLLQAWIMCGSSEGGVWLFALTAAPHVPKKALRMPLFIPEWCGYGNLQCFPCQRFCSWHGTSQETVPKIKTDKLPEILGGFFISLFHRHQTMITCFGLMQVMAEDCWEIPFAWGCFRGVVIAQVSLTVCWRFLTPSLSHSWWIALPLCSECTCSLSTGSEIFKACSHKKTSID